MGLFRITENKPSKMHNVRPYVYSRPCVSICFADGIFMRFHRLEDTPIIPRPNSPNNEILAFSYHLTPLRWNAIYNWTIFYILTTSRQAESGKYTGKNLHVTSRDVTWRHNVRFPPFPSCISCVFPSLKSFASLKGKLWALPHLQIQYSRITGE